MLHCIFAAVAAFVRDFADFCSHIFLMKLCACALLLPPGIWRFVIWMCGFSRRARPVASHSSNSAASSQPRPLMLRSTSTLSHRESIGRAASICLCVCACMCPYVFCVLCKVYVKNGCTYFPCLLSA